MQIYAVVVTFQIAPGKMAAFMPPMQANAKTSLAKEEGCLRFSICTDLAYPDDVFLYELYTDRAAFDLHLTSAHFKHFDAQVTAMIATKSIRTFQDVIT